LFYENTDEYDNFYDFTDSYKSYVTRDFDPSIETEEEYFDKIMDQNAIKISDDGLRLELKDGRVLGHRSLVVYYKQKLRLPESRESVLANKLMAQARLLTWNEQHWNPKGRELIPHQRIIAERTRLGVKANGLLRFMFDPNKLCM